MKYTLTLPEGTITYKGGNYHGTATTGHWSPANPDTFGGLKDKDTVSVVCTFNLNPTMPHNVPMPGYSDYYGLCVGACEKGDTAAITRMETAKYYSTKTGQLVQYPLDGVMQTTTTTNAVATPENIFYNAQSESQPSTVLSNNRGTLPALVYNWTMTYNGSNDICSNGKDVEIVYGYGDPMDGDTEA